MRRWITPFIYHLYNVPTFLLLCLQFLHVLLRDLHSLPKHANKLQQKTLTISFPSQILETGIIAWMISFEDLRIHNQVLTSFSSSVVMIRVGDIMMISPDTRTNKPNFAHSAPKYDPIPGRTHHATHFEYFTNKYPLLQDKQHIEVSKGCMSWYN